MATKLADAYVQIIPSAKGIQGSISNVLNGEAQRAGTSAGAGIASKLKGAIAAAGIGAAITKAVKASIDAGSELQQNIGGTEAVFGNFAETVQNNAAEAYKSMGMSASDYMATANKMGSLFQGSGLEQEKALELTSKAMQRAADVASVMGIDTSQAMESIAGAAKGNFTMMDNLGVAMNAATIEAYALEKGLNFKWNTATNAEKAEVAMEMFFERTSQYADNFANEAETTFSGSFSSISAAATNLLGNMSLGKDIQGPLNNLLSTTRTFVFGNFIPMLKNIVLSIPQIFSTAWQMASNAFKDINWLEMGQNLISDIKTGITNLQTDIPQAMDDIGNAAKEWFESVDWKQTGQDIIGLLSEGITILTDDIPQLIKDIGLKAIEWIGSVNWLETGTAIINFIGDGIETVVDSIPGAIQSIGNTAKAWFEAIEWSKVGETVIGLLKAGIQKLVIDIPLAIMNIAWEAIKWFKGVLWEASGGDIIGFIASGIAKFVTTIPLALLNIGYNAIKWFLGALWKSAGGTVIGDIVSGIAEFVTAIPDKIKEIREKAIEYFKGGFWKTSGKSVIRQIVSGVADFFTMIPDKLREIAKSGIEYIKNSSWLASGHAIITRTVKGIKEFFTKIPDKLMEIIKDAIAKITDPETWLQVGKDIVNGIVDGIKSIPGAIGGALTGAVKSAKDAVCGFLDINSPSKLFRDDVGSPIAEGIIAGFDRGIKGFSGDMISSINDAKEAAADSMRVSAGYTISGRSHQMDAMPATIAGAVLDGVQQIADGVERGIGKMKMVANNRETARFVADLGFVRA